jgi:plasmid stability protein
MSIVSTQTDKPATARQKGCAIYMRSLQINIRSMNRETRQKFKAWCVQHESNMEDTLRQVIAQILAGKLKPVIEPAIDKNFGE